MSDILKYLETVGSRADLRHVPAAYRGPSLRGDQESAEVVHGMISSAGSCQMVSLVMPFMDEK